MKTALWALGLALVLGVSAPFAVALTLAGVLVPAAYQAALDSCLPPEDEPGLPTGVTFPADTEALDCVPVPGELPSGPDDVCPPSGSAAERGLKPHAVRALRCVKQRFPWIKYMGGVGSRPSGYVSDHPRGLAVDFMIPAWSTRAGNARGWEVAHWLQAHAKELHAKYVIFDDRSWRSYNPSAGWRPYSYPGPNAGSATARHRDHVHISVYP